MSACKTAFLLKEVFTFFSNFLVFRLDLS